jgi:hypothetical protein
VGAELLVPFTLRPIASRRRLLGERLGSEAEEGGADWEELVLKPDALEGRRE